MENTDWYKLMRCNLPEQELNDIKIQKFEVTEQDAEAFNFRQLFQNRPEKIIHPGKYTKLKEKNILWMSDTPGELESHIIALINASKTCLLTGLGLGCVAKGMLKKKNPDNSYAVDKLIILEKNKDIITLVGSKFLKKYKNRLEIRGVDALEYTPPRGERYQCVWNDIWPNISLDNHEEIVILRKKYKHLANWIGAWSEAEIKQIKARNSDRRHRKCV